MIKHDFTLKFLKSHPKLRLLMKILRFWFYMYTHFHIFIKTVFSLKRKWLIVITVEVIILWLYWGIFPFHYFRYKLYFNNNISIKNLKKYIPEFYFDNIIVPEYNEWSNRLLMSNKVFMSKLYLKFKIPSPQLVLYSDNSYLFDNNNKMLDLKIFKDFKTNLKSDKLFLKPAYGSSGNGILLFKKRNMNYYNNSTILDFNTLKKISKHYNFILENEIAQDNILIEYNSDSINTLRIITLLVDGEIKLLKAVLRMGRKGVYVDNSAQGGISCEVDID